MKATSYKRHQVQSLLLHENRKELGRLDSFQCVQVINVIAWSNRRETFFMSQEPGRYHLCLHHSVGKESSHLLNEELKKESLGRAS